MNGTEGVGDREDLIGRATGAMVMALFGLLWALGCAGVLVAGALGPILLASSAVVTAILVAASLRLRRAAQRALPSETRSSRRAAVPAHADLIRWRFRLVGVVQGLGIGIAVFACVRFGRPELIPAAAALVVGLHFFPLAPLFRVPLCAWSPPRRRSRRCLWARRPWLGRSCPGWARRRSCRRRAPSWLSAGSDRSGAKLDPCHCLSVLRTILFCCYPDSKILLGMVGGSTLYSGGSRPEKRGPFRTGFRLFPVAGNLQRMRENPANPLAESQHPEVTRNEKKGSPTTVWKGGRVSVSYSRAARLAECSWQVFGAAPN